MPALKIKLTKSYAGAPVDQVAAVRGLGLKKFGDEKILKDTPAIRGMIFKVQHLVSSESVKQEAQGRKRQKPRKEVLRQAARAKEAQPQK
ncbi:MAG: 50S ribosomal protein L30 [Myxococcaceae bacterium]